MYERNALSGLGMVSAPANSFNSQKGGEVSNFVVRPFVDPASWGWKLAEDSEIGNLLEKLVVKIFGFPPDLTRT
jgi:hypothetical protein